MHSDPIVLDEMAILIDNEDKTRAYVAIMVKQYLLKKRTKVTDAAFEVLVEEALQHYKTQSTKKEAS